MPAVVLDLRYGELGDEEGSGVVAEPRAGNQLKVVRFYLRMLMLWLVLNLLRLELAAHPFF